MFYFLANSTKSITFVCNIICKLKFTNGTLICREAGCRKQMAELISHEGIVVCALESESRLPRVRIRIEQKAACSACKAKSMCTASETMVKEVDASALEPMEAGDRVEVSVEKRLGWKAVLLAFVLPFTLLLLMVWLLPHFIGSEALVGTLAICSLAPYYLILRLFSRKMEAEYQFTARKLS